MSDARRPAHLVLSGGGARCLSFVGALEQLERDYRWASVSACSMGTLIGAMRCVGMRPEEMRDALLAFEYRSVPEVTPWRLALNAWRVARPPYAVVPTSPVPAIFRRLVGDDRAGRTLGQLDPPLAAGAVDIETRRLVVYSSQMHPDVPVDDLLEITMSLPPLFPLVRREQSVLVDASVSWSAPIWLTAAFEGNLPIVVLRAIQGRPAGKSRITAQSLRMAGQQSHDTFVIESTPDVTVHDVVTRHHALARLSRAKRAELMDQGRNEVARARERQAESLEGSYAALLYSRHQERLHRNPPSTVFISYAHEDREWVERLRFQLNELIPEESISIWDDAYLGPGERWRSTIEQAISRASVAVLLVSAHFQASSFIQNVEMPLLLDRLRHDRLLPLWVSLDSTRPSGPLLDYQAAVDSEDAAAMSDPAKMNEQMAAVRRSIERHFARLPHDRTGTPPPT